MEAVHQKIKPHLHKLKDKSQAYLIYLPLFSIIWTPPLENPAYTTTDSNLEYTLGKFILTSEDFH